LLHFFSSPEQLYTNIFEKKWYSWPIADVPLNQNYVFSLNEDENVKYHASVVLPYEAAWLWKNQERRWFLVHRGMASLSGLQQKPEYQLLGKDDLHTHVAQY